MAQFYLMKLSENFHADRVSECQNYSIQFLYKIWYFTGESSIILIILLDNFHRMHRHYLINIYDKQELNGLTYHFELPIFTMNKRHEMIHSYHISRMYLDTSIFGRMHCQRIYTRINILSLIRILCFVM